MEPTSNNVVTIKPRDLDSKFVKVIPHEGHVRMIVRGTLVFPEGESIKLTREEAGMLISALQESVEDIWVEELEEALKQGDDDEPQ